MRQILLNLDFTLHQGKQPNLLSALPCVCVPRRYLDYGAPDWRAMSKCCLTKMNLFVDEVRADFEKVMDDLDEHACSRTDGLGSRIPWDRQYLIENMSDSNINMAYYTVCPLIQGYSWDGSKPGPANIR